MIRRNFIKIFSIVLVCVLLVFSLGIIALHQSGSEMMRERLIAECNLSIALLKDREDIQLFKKYEADSAFRITVIEQNGDVFYDSLGTQLENHKDREEIVSALNGESKAVERYSKTLGCSMIYYAKKTSLSDGSQVVVRLAISSYNTKDYFRVSIPMLVGGLLLAIVATAILSRILSYTISKKALQIEKRLKQINVGEYEPFIIKERDPSFDSIFKEINSLNANVTKRIIGEKNEKTKLQEVLNNISQGIIALSNASDIVFVNNSALKLFSGNADCVGKKPLVLIDDIPLAEKLLYIENEDFSFEYKYKSKYLSVAVKKIADKTLSKSIEAIIIITDITKQKGISKQKSDFFANASHELKTPITVMQGLTEILLSKESLDDSTKKQVERIHKESLRMASLIADMLKLSKLEASEEEPPSISINLRHVAEEIFSELTEQMAQKNISYMIIGECSIMADPKRAYELIGNLCSNAVNYNKENGSIEVILTEEYDRAIIKVKDTGIGIDKEHLPRICERFYRVDKSRSKKTGGTGLGLAIVKHICALYSAEMTIDSQIDKGTTVTVTFKK